jgi:hypothetical protein
MAAGYPNAEAGEEANMAEQKSMDELQARAARVNAQLRAAPVVEILGLVGPSGASGSKGGPGTPWHMNATLAAWKLPAGRVQTTPLQLRRQVEHEQLEGLQRSLTAYAVRRLRVRLLVDNEMGTPQAWLEEIAGAAQDEGLEAEAARLRAPVLYLDPVFGTCTLDRALDWFETKGQWLGQEISVHLSTGDIDALPELLEHAHALWADQAGWQARLNETAVRDLLALKNDNWLDDDEKPLSAAQFTPRMQLQSVTFHPDGDFEFCFEDGELFWGHVIMIAGSVADGPEEASIAG